jgi:hypothetical protein
MMAIRILLIFLFVFGQARAAERADPRDDSYMGIPITKDPRPKFVLFSWRGKDSAYRFALMPNTRKKLHSFLDEFRPNRPGILRLEDLERELAKLPKRSLVTWMKDEPHAVTYPEQSVVRKVKKFATRMQLDLQFNETRYEQPGV